jgi:hypothetical protein
MVVLSDTPGVGPGMKAFTRTTLKWARPPSSDRGQPSESVAVFTGNAAYSFDTVTPSWMPPPPQSAVMMVVLLAKSTNRPAQLLLELLSLLTGTRFGHIPMAQWYDLISLLIWMRVEVIRITDNVPCPMPWKFLQRCKHKFLEMGKPFAEVNQSGYPSKVSCT